MSARFLLLWFSGVAIVALIARARMHQGGELCCSFDGVPVETGGRVDLVAGQEKLASFCGVECALAWPARMQAARASRFVVHEERYGAALDPGAAFFVRCPQAARGQRSCLRAFADPLSAAEYAHSFGGVPVPNPFDEDSR